MLKKPDFFGGRILLALTVFGLGACAPEPFALKRVFFCDDSTGDECRLPAPENGVYAFVAPGSKRSSWRDLGYYMYFHARQTPGLRAEWNNALEPARRAALEQSLHCEYSLERGPQSVSGELEGERVDENGRGLWCFDYLGTMLIEFHKKYGSIEKPPAAEFFPVTLRLRFETDDPQIRGEKSTPITVRWD